MQEAGRRHGAGGGGNTHLEVEREKTRILPRTEPARTKSPCTEPLHQWSMPTSCLAACRRRAGQPTRTRTLVRLSPGAVIWYSGSSWQRFAPTRTRTRTQTSTETHRQRHTDTVARGVKPPAARKLAYRCTSHPSIRHPAPAGPSQRRGAPSLGSCAAHPVARLCSRPAPQLACSTPARVEHAHASLTGRTEPPADCHTVMPDTHRAAKQSTGARACVRAGSSAQGAGDSTCASRSRRARREAEVRADEQRQAAPSTGIEGTDIQPRQPPQMTRPRRGCARRNRSRGCLKSSERERHTGGMSVWT